jgi:hypothetical protein
MGSITSKYAAGDAGNIECLLNVIITCNKFTEKPIVVHYIGSDNEKGVQAFVDFLKPLKYTYLGICFYIAGEGILGNQYQLMAYKTNFVELVKYRHSRHSRHSNLK